LGHRLVPYIDSATPLMFDERHLYNEVIRGGAFEFFCPSYLMEAGVDSESCVVDYAAATTYRFPRNRFATVLCNNGFVKKIPLCAEAKKNTRQIVKTHDDLSGYGVNVLSLEIDSNDIITMKRINAPILIDYWCNKWKAGTLTTDEVIGHYDIIKSEIEKASVNGVCYAELVPANCFIESGELVFFDQEFSCEFDSPKYAADVTMTRAMLALTIYNHAEWDLGIKDDEFTTKIVETLQHRYGLAKRWDELVKEADWGITHKQIFSDSLEPLATASRRIQERSEAAREAAREAAYMPCVAMLKNWGIKRPIIYGYGLRGRALRYACEDEDIKVVAVVDRDESKLRFIYDTKVSTSLEDALTKTQGVADGIIISLLAYKPILEEIKEQIGSEPDMAIYTLAELLDKVKKGEE
jgi:hypothetical protein